MRPGKAMVNALSAWCLSLETARVRRSPERIDIVDVGRRHRVLVVGIWSQSGEGRFVDHPVRVRCRRRRRNRGPGDHRPSGRSSQSDLRLCGTADPKDSHDGGRIAGPSDTDLRRRVRGWRRHRCAGDRPRGRDEPACEHDRCDTEPRAKRRALGHAGNPSARTASGRSRVRKPGVVGVTCRRLVAEPGRWAASGVALWKAPVLTQSRRVHHRG